MPEHQHHHHSTQVAGDLLWEIVRNQNAYLVKRKTSGGVMFSRDPFNVAGTHSRKHAGFVNDKAVGVLPSTDSKGGVTLVTKKTKHTQRPASHTHSVDFSGGKGTRKTYKSIVSSTAKSGYRPDLREHAVARASQIRASQRPVKEGKLQKEKKLRGKKAKEAAAKEAME